MPPYHHSHSPADIQNAASAPSTTSPHHVTPPVPKSHFTPGLGLPSLPFLHPDLSAMQAPTASVLHICDPWFATCHRYCDLCQGCLRAKLRHMVVVLHGPAFQTVQLQATRLDPNTGYTAEGTNARYQAKRVS